MRIKLDWQVPVSYIEYCTTPLSLSVSLTSSLSVEGSFLICSFYFTKCATPRESRVRSIVCQGPRGSSSRRAKSSPCFFFFINSLDGSFDSQLFPLRRRRRRWQRRRRRKWYKWWWGLTGSTHECRRRIGRGRWRRWTCW